MRNVLTSVTLAAFALAGVTAEANLIVDGGFELPVAPGSYFSQYVGGNTFGGWTVTGNDVLVIDKNYTETGVGGIVHFGAEEGNQSLDITGAGNTGPGDGVFQSVTTTIGQRYSLSFYVGRTDADPDDPRYSTPSSVDLSINNGSLQTFTNSAFTQGDINWKYFSTSFVASGTSTKIAFSNGTPVIPGGNNFAGLDNVTLSAVPGPASLVTFGMTSLAMFRRRRKSSK